MVLVFRIVFRFVLFKRIVFVLFDISVLLVLRKMFFNVLVDWLDCVSVMYVLWIVCKLLFCGVRMLIGVSLLYMLDFMMVLVLSILICFRFLF